MAAAPTINALCDELLEEIFGRLPRPSAPSVSLVCRRWLRLLRHSVSFLSLHSPPSVPLLSAFLSHYPFLSSLTLVSSSAAYQPPDALLLAVAASPSASRLAALRLLTDSPISPSSALAAAPSFSRLTSLQLSSVLPFSFHWLAALPLLHSFSLLSPSISRCNSDQGESNYVDEEGGRVLPLVRLSLCGIRAGDRGLAWLWRRCGNLRWLQLRACDGIGDTPALQEFPNCLARLHALELRACRVIADRVLHLAAEHCQSLVSLLIYDGGGRDALRNFIYRRGAALRTIDLRLPLDLHNDHLLAIAGPAREHRLAVLRLHSCCLITGDGLRSLARAPASAAIEELALVSCDVVDREPGLLSFLVQSMPRLRMLDLSDNETLTDKEVGAMVASCPKLVEIRLRGCAGLSGQSLISLIKHCSCTLEVVDISCCKGIGVSDIEGFCRRAGRVKYLTVEESKISDVAKACVSQKGIKVA